MLDTLTAENDLFELLEDQATRTDDYHKAHRDFAKEMVRIWTAFVKSGTVTGTVSTTGTASAQVGNITSAHIA